MFRQLMTIARNTFIESIRQPIFVVLVLLGGVMTALNVSLSAYSMETGGGDNKMLIDMGLSTIAFVGVLLAAFTATGVLSREIENKTVLTVVSKPVARPTFVLGKFLGVVSAIILSCYILSLALILVLRHRVMSTASDHFDGPVLAFGLGALVLSLLIAIWGNYYLRWVFSSTFILILAASETLAVLLVLIVGKDWIIQSPVTDFLVDDGRMWQVVIGLILVFEAVVLLTGLAVAVSTRLGQVMTVLICLGAFLLGLVTQSLSQAVNSKLSLTHDLSVASSLSAIWTATADLDTPTRIAYSITQAIYTLFPNLQFLWPADAITQGNPISAGYIATTSLYASLQLIAILAIAVALFQNREVG